ncbi:MAG: hypothetical protein Q9196_002214 [Gyalolechia fulgens]
MAEVPNNKHKGHFWCWYEAMVSKFQGIGPAYTPADLDTLLEDYSAVTDIPCVLFADELLTAFPDAKVILTNRDVDSWLESMEKDIAKYLELLRMAIGSWTSGDWQSRSQLREGFHRHYQHIRSSVPEDRLLEFRSEDGWLPLCRFLDKPVPTEKYPRVNSGNELFHIHYLLILMSTLSLVISRMVWLAPIAIILFVARYAQTALRAS